MTKKEQIKATEELIEHFEEMLLQAKKQLKDNPKSLFFKGLIKNYTESIEDLNKCLSDIRSMAK